MTKYCIQFERDNGDTWYSRDIELASDLSEQDVDWAMRQVAEQEGFVDHPYFIAVYAPAEELQGDEEHWWQWYCGDRGYYYRVMSEMYHQAMTQEQ